MFIVEPEISKIGKILRKLFSRKPWIILIVALVIFAAFTTAIVYEQYVMNQDNFAKFLPSETVLYAHGNTLVSSQVYRPFDKFFEFHPFFKAKLKMA